jgi:hypothetical protein
MLTNPQTFFMTLEDVGEDTNFRQISLPTNRIRPFSQFYFASVFEKCTIFYFAAVILASNTLNNSDNTPCQILADRIGSKYPPD